MTSFSDTTYYHTIILLRNGLVVLSFDNKSANPRVTVGQVTAYLALSDIPRALPPLLELATLANCKFLLERITYVTYLNRGLRRDLSP